MTSALHDIEIIGHIRPEIAAQLHGHVNSSAAGGAAVLLAADNPPDRQHLLSVLEQGRVLVLLEPSCATSELLQSITGTIIGETQAIAVRRDAQGKYHLASWNAAVALAGGAAGEVVAAPAPPLAVEVAEAAPLGKRIAALLDSLAQPVAAGLGGLIGPAGSPSGEVSFYVPMAGELGVNPTFKHAANKTQAYNAACNTTFYVYHIEKQGQNEEHYIVIAKLQANFNAGTLLVDSDCNRGYGTFQAAAEIRNVEAGPGTIQLLSASPDSNGDTASVSREMRIRQDTAGGTAILPTLVSDSAKLELTDWSVDKRTSHGPASAGWAFTQNNLRNGFGDIRQTLFNNQDVKPLSSIAKSSLSVTTFAAWRVSDHAKPVVRLGLEIVQHFFIVANGGCRTQDSRYAEWVARGTGSRRYELDLFKICGGK